MQHDERTAAMLHGKKRSGMEKSPSHRFSSEDAASNPSSHRVLDDSQRGRRSSTQIREQRNLVSRQVSRDQRGTASKKRNAATSLSLKSARLQRSNAPELQDEAFVRRTMRIPTPKDYPTAPSELFRRPRVFIHNLTSGKQLAECRSDFTLLGNAAHQCTATYESAMHTESVIGEGSTKAGRSVSWNRM